MNIVINNDYIPNEQKDEYFVISVYGIKLAWVLDEPFPYGVPITDLRSKIKNFFKKNKSTNKK